MQRILQMLSRNSAGEQQQATEAPPVPIPSLAKMSTNLARKSLAAATGSSDAPKVRIGICAMDKKARSKPMKEIVNRLLAYGEFEMVYFGDEVILDQPVETWPEVDCILSWYSDGFPLRKAQAYADLRRPFLVNDLHSQDLLMDRRKVYQVLQDNAIPVPHHIIVNRDGLPEGADPAGFMEEEDYVELDGVRIYKPFVEKPVSGEDHNIHIYYPHSMGGGVKRLFRKVNDKSSTYDPNHSGNVRRHGSFIYEEFLATGGTDVKVYTVGPRYAHAEARKSPVVDGKVLRAADGKEMRFPVLLTPQEKEIARMVTLAFAQKVCGFDLLRSEKGKSYVCDVNGWSFVKSSKKYYEDASGILRSIILSALAPHRLSAAPALTLRPSLEDPSKPSGGDGAGEEGEGPLHMPKASSLQELSTLAEMSGAELASLATLSGWDLEELRRTEDLAAHEELRCVLAVIRHGDRTPKQKMKVRVTQPQLLAMFQKYKDSKGKQAKLKSPNQLQELLDITRQLLQQLEHPEQGGEPLAQSEEEREELIEKFRIVRTVLEQGGHFSGINRKVQLKPLVWETPSPSGGTKPAAEEGGPPAMPSVSSTASDADPGTPAGGGVGGLLPAYSCASSLSRRGQGSGAGRPGAGGSAGPAPVLKEALMILKWGGVLTHAGRQQAEDLGRIFRLIMYPRYGAAGGGLLRLHSTYRHDLKIYSSDEGRVQSSAAAFTKGLLDLEGESLTPILVSLVQKDASMLDAFGKGASEDIKNAKHVLYTTMTADPTQAGPAGALAATTPSQISPASTPVNLSRSPSVTGPPSAHPPEADTSTEAFGSGPQHQQGRQRAEAAVAGQSGGAVQPTGSTATGASTNSSATDLSTLPEEQQQQQQVPATGAAPSTTSTSNSAPGSTSPLAPQQQQPSSPAATGGLGDAQQQQQSLLTPAAGAAAAAGQQGRQARLSTTLSSTLSMEQPAPVTCRGDIPHMPPEPLQHLRTLHQLMQLLVNQLRDMCVKERIDPAADVNARYSSLSQDPREWVCVPDRPCGGERLLLVFDRWQKLTKSFYKKGRFDISKVPDIYDSAKYDALHNSHLELAVLPDLYYEAKILADAVIPNEYGLDSAGKLAIGSKICGELLGKLLSDLESMRQESLATMPDDEAQQGLRGGEGGVLDDDDIGRVSLQDEAMLMRQAGATAAAGGHAGGDEADAEEDPGDEPETIHRLCPMYASDINSPLRHVRTRIYFTSESHMHSLLNVLRYCHLDPRCCGRSPGSAPSSTPLSTAGSAEPSAAPSAPSAAAAAAAGKSSSTPAAAGAGCGPGAAAAGCSMSSQSSAALTGPSRGCSPRATHSSHLPYFYNSSMPPSAALSHCSSSNSRVDGLALDAAAAAAAAAVAAAGGREPAARAAEQRPQVDPGSSGSSSNCKEALLSDEAAAMLEETTELDYLTQLVFRMYENKAVPADHPNRFRVEVLFSSGASYNPITHIPPLRNHTLPAKPRGALHRGVGVPMASFKARLGPQASTKRQPQPQAYALTVGLKAPSPLVAKAAAGALV